MLVEPCHPASKDAPERVVQPMKLKLKKSAFGDFRKHLARILFQYRTTPHEVASRVPCELLPGRKIKTPLDLIHPDLRSTSSQKQLKHKMHPNQGRTSNPLPGEGDVILAKNVRLEKLRVAGGVENRTSDFRKRVAARRFSLPSTRGQPACRLRCSCTARSHKFLFCR